MNAIETVGLCKSFPGGVVALTGLEMQVPHGTLFGLLGRNGAGKSTLLRVLMGLLRPDAGHAHVLGGDLRAATRDERARVAYVAQEPRLFGTLSTADHAGLLACYYPRFDTDAARALAKRFDVPWGRSFATLSGGGRRKAALLLAVATRADLLLLDEPGAGLDPLARRELIDVLVDVVSDATEATVVLSTHLVADVERLAERVGFIDAGRALRTDSVETLKERLRRVQVVFDGDPPAGFEVPGALRTERTGSVITAIAELTSERDLAPVFALPGARVDLFGLTLEDIFVEIVGQATDVASERRAEEVLA